jgi:hypothetical protein
LELGLEDLFFTGVLCGEVALGEGNMSLDDCLLENEPFRGVLLGLGILTCVDAGDHYAGAGGEDPDEDPDDTPPDQNVLHTHCTVCLASYMVGVTKQHSSGG